MDTVAVTLKQFDRGWAVVLTDGREIARFTGLGARWRAIRYIAGGNLHHAPQDTIERSSGWARPRRRGVR